MTRSMTRVPKYQCLVDGWPEVLNLGGKYGTLARATRPNDELRNVSRRQNTLISKTLKAFRGDK